MKLIYDNIKHLYTKSGGINPHFTRSTNSFLFSELYYAILVQTQFLPENSPLGERLYCIKENIEELPLCNICKIAKCHYCKHGFYRKTCNSKKCLYKSEEYILKLKQTTLERHGDENYRNIVKSKQTKLRNHGNENYNNVQKLKQTCLEKYSVENVYQSEQIKEKLKQTKLQRYNNENYNNSEKAKYTRLIKYGVEHSLQSVTILNKLQQTNLKKYGSTSFNNKHIAEDKFKLYNNEEWLRKQIEILKRPTKDIAEELGILSVANIIKKCKKFNIYIPVNNYSNAAINWLEYISKQQQIYIQHARNEGEYRIPNTKFLADGFHEETNTVFEFYGNIWHGNLDIYKPGDKPHPFSNMTALELFEKTIQREEIIKSLGYNVVSIWEKEWNNHEWL